MKTYIVTMRVEAEDDVNAEQIREEIYDACPDVNFGFDITSVTEAAGELLTADEAAERIDVAHLAAVSFAKRTRES